MPKSSKDLIEKTLKNCDLTKKELSEIELELESHFFEAERELNMYLYFVYSF
ncbi:MAG: hypothetical protein V1898_04605 [Patescibacteria group bacterium]